MVAESAAEAMRVAETNRVDLLISDVEMPGMTGPELILTLQHRGLIERSLLVTGNVEAIDRVNGLDSSVPLLAKPFNCDQLLRKIHTILND